MVRKEWVPAFAGMTPSSVIQCAGDSYLCRNATNCPLDHSISPAKSSSNSSN
jgi:hypothetical protein